MRLFKQKEEFRKVLISWYLREKRDLPWRRTSDPYHIWVSEVMLQQTRVETVIPYFERFIDKYPTVFDLATANEEELLKVWEGLGYYSRVRNLQSGVKEVAANYGGIVPSTRGEISKLKGVGPYTAGAVLSIAYNIPEHAVDGNVMRVLSRILLIEDDIAQPKNRKIFEEVVMELIDKEDPSSFNQGMMELGALICTPKPKCLLCPVQQFCGAFHEGKQEELPVKLKKVKKKIVPVFSFALQNEKGEWLLMKRPETGLLANMWEFPMIEMEKNISAEQALYEKFGVKIKHLSPEIRFKHIFSHLTWEIQSFHGIINELPLKQFQFFSEEEVEALPMPVPVLKIWTELKSR